MYCAAQLIRAITIKFHRKVEHEQALALKVWCIFQAVSIQMYFHSPFYSQIIINFLWAYLLISRNKPEIINWTKDRWKDRGHHHHPFSSQLWMKRVDEDEKRLVCMSCNYCKKDNHDFVAKKVAQLRPIFAWETDQLLGPTLLIGKTPKRAMLEENQFTGNWTLVGKSDEVFLPSGISFQSRF